MPNFRALWLHVDSSSTSSQIVQCFAGDDLAGSLTLAVRNAQDEDNPSVGLMWASVEPHFRGGAVGAFLIEEVQRHFPGVRITAGPVGDDEDAGPRFRLRCWEANAPIHEMGCGSSNVGECDCLAWIKREVIHRLGKRRDEGGSSHDVVPTQEYKQSILSLGL